jgi:hypothetical protein
MKFSGKMNAEKEPVQTLIFMDFETAGKLLETEFSGDLQPRNGAGLQQTEFLKKLLESGLLIKAWKIIINFYKQISIFLGFRALLKCPLFSSRVAYLLKQLRTCTSN